MQWIAVRLMLEASFISPLIEAFGGCVCLEDMLTKFGSFDEMKKLGVIAGIVLVLATFVECIKLGLTCIESTRRVILKFLHQRANRKFHKPH